MEEQNKSQESKVEESSEQSSPEISTGSGTNTQTNSSSKHLIVGLVVVVALVGAYVLYNHLNSPTDGESETETEMLGGVSVEDYPEVVGVVNGEELPRSDFMLSFGQELQAASQQGADLSNETIIAQLEEQALSRLVNTVLLIQVAKESGTELDTATLDAEMERIMGQFETEEAYVAAIAEQGLTPEGLREDIGDQLLVNQFLAANESLNAPSVSQAEIQAVYDELIGSQEGMPPVEEISPAIAEQLAAQKQQQLIGEYIETLRAEAEIETSL